MNDNQNTPPTPNDDPPQDSPGMGGGSSILRTVAKVILTVGLVTLAYGVIGCWVIPSLPPNGFAIGRRPIIGRLPSIYIMGAGIVVTMFGLVMHSMKLSRHGKKNASQTRNTIPTSLGMLVLLAIVIAVIVAIARL